MRFQFAIAIFLLFAVICYQVSSSALPNPGPHTWCINYPSCCGLLQSPINILADSTTYVPFPPFNFINYNVPIKIVLKNTGHTVSVSVASGSVIPRVSHGSLLGVYQLEFIHFHWGYDSSLGSEHVLDGQTYPLESHLVHYNTKYANFSAALNHVDGLAVFAIFYDIQHARYRYRPFKQVKLNLEPLVEEFENIAFPDTSTQVPQPIVLRDFLPKDLFQFYRYNGSLTSPPCNEVVTWTVFEGTLPVSEAQMRRFRQDLRADDTDEVINDNYRDPQDGHDRLVLHNVDKLRYVFKNCRLQFPASMIRPYNYNSYSMSTC